MKVKKSNAVNLHRLAEIKKVEQSSDSPNTLYIEGYASFYQNDLGLKEVDRDQEVVNVNGLDVEAFAKNPVLLWNHDWSEVRGRVTSITKDGKGLYVKAEMHRLTGKEADFENVLYGNVKSFSIGFIPHEYEYLEDAVEITKSEMIELSIAPVQSNRSALFQVIGTKSLDVNKEDLKSLLEDNKKDTNMKNKLSKDAEPVQESVQTEPKDEPKDEPKEVAPKDEPKVEVAPEMVQAEPKDEPKDEPKAQAEPVSIDYAKLAQELAQATIEAEKIKEQTKAEAELEAEKAEKDKAEAEKQKIQDALNFIRTQKEEFSKLSLEELDAREEEFDEFVDVVTEATDVIHSKIAELTAQALESGTPSEE